MHMVPVRLNSKAVAIVVKNKEKPNWHCNNSLPLGLKNALVLQDGPWYLDSKTTKYLFHDDDQSLKLSFNVHLIYKCSFET